MSHPLRLLAQIVSVLFHPLLMLTYMLLILLAANPYLFSVNHMSKQTLLVLQVFITSFAFPLFAVLMMRYLGLVNSLTMRERQERIGPFIATGIFYLWVFYNAYKSQHIPLAFAIFALGSSLALFLAFFITLFVKISLHAVGMGGLLGMVLITYFAYSYGAAQFGNVALNMKFVVVAAIVLSGVVGTARLILGAHTPDELYGGYFIGFVTQLLAFQLLA